MSRFIPLESVRVASPCHADWAMMDGNDRVKLCGSCRKNVYNISHMTRHEAEALIATHEDGLCVRFYRRADGTILTGDCPIGSMKARPFVGAPLKWVAAAVALYIASCCWVVSQEGSSPEDEELRAEGYGRLLSALLPVKSAEPTSVPSPPEHQEVMGFVNSSFDAPNLSTPLNAGSPTE